MSGADVLHLYGPHYAVRDLALAWDAAGQPPINSALRLYAEQKAAWNAYRNGTGSPADNPDQPNIYPLAHVRGAALDIDPTTARVNALHAAGLVRPYSYEPWHWELRNVRSYPLVHALPASAGGGAVPFPEGEDNMALTPADITLLLNTPAYLVWSDGTRHPNPPSISEVLREIDVLYQGTFNGGPILQDDGKSISQSLAEIQERLSNPVAPVE